MAASVIGKGGQCRLIDWVDADAANRFLDHLVGRAFAAATVRAYAYDVLSFARFCQGRGLRLAEVAPVDLFDWVGWQTAGARPRSGTVVAMVRHAGAAPASVNRRVAAVRALFEYLVMCGDRAENPVPAPRRGQGLRAKSRGVLGHLGPGRPRTGGRLVRSPRRLPESLDRDEVAAFLVNLLTHRDRAIVLAMLLGGLRAGEVRRLRLADVDVGVAPGPGGRQRQPGTGRPGRRGVLRRADQLSAAGASARAGHAGVFRGAGRRDSRAAADRGRFAECVPSSPRHLWRGPGPAAPAAAHLRHRARGGRDRLVGAAGLDGSCQPGNHCWVRASVAGASGGRVRRRPSHAGGRRGAGRDRGRGPLGHRP